MGGVMAVFVNFIKYIGLLSILAFSCLFLLMGLPCGQLFVSDASAAEEIKAVPAKTDKSGPGLGKQSMMGKGDKEPTVITANSLTADNQAKTALFTGNVVAKKGEGTLFADKMLVYYTDAGDGENGNIDRIECTGKVKLVRNYRIITAGKAVYYAGKDERVVFTESPRATENRNVVIGSVMTYYFKDDRSVVENSKIYIVEKEGGNVENKPSYGKPAAKGLKKK
jgi:lipopolysaccharide export system protein LptA